MVRDSLALAALAGTRAGTGRTVAGSERVNIDASVEKSRGYINQAKPVLRVEFLIVL
jgi:hypothetical protein